MKIKRVFYPGEEWLYMKIYIGYSIADKLLYNEIYSAVNELQRKNIITKWFFIRYYDEDFHIRIRFLLTNSENAMRVITLFNKSLKQYLNKNLLRIQIDTYTRELERYNPNIIEHCESIFYFESNFILKVLKKIKNSKENEKYRWMVAIKLMNNYFTSFKLDENSKFRILEDTNLYLKTQFGYKNNNNIIFRDKYRRNRHIINEVLSNDIKDPLFNDFFLKNNYLSSTIPLIMNNKKSMINIESLVKDLIHMMINRLFISQNNLYELILYDFMLMYFNGFKSRKNREIGLKTQ